MNAWNMKSWLCFIVCSRQSNSHGQRMFRQCLQPWTIYHISNNHYLLMLFTDSRYSYTVVRILITKEWKHHTSLVRKLMVLGLGWVNFWAKRCFVPSPDSIFWFIRCSGEDSLDSDRSLPSVPSIANMPRRTVLYSLAACSYLTR